MNRSLFVAVALSVILFSSCTATPSAQSGFTQATPSVVAAETSAVAGLLSMSAAVICYHPGTPMIDYLVLEYARPITLPDTAPETLYSFSDTQAANSQRTVSAVYTSSQPQPDPQETSTAGRYVIVKLDRVENPVPGSRENWRAETTAGIAINWTGAHTARRTDYSGIQLKQNFAAVDAAGTIIQPPGPLPQITPQEVTWPELKDFTIDTALKGTTGTIHYSCYLPKNYDPSGSYPLVVTLPGYNALRFDETSGGVNIYENRSAVVWTQQREDVIVLCPQLTSWDQESALQTIELTEYFLRHYAIDASRVYGVGYSAGGETMSQVIGMRADLFAAYLHCSSQWDGGYTIPARNRTAIYVFMAISDEYYGSGKAVDAYDRLCAAYRDIGVTAQELKSLLVLNTPDNDYFNCQGIYNYHGGGMTAINDEMILQWILTQRKQGETTQ